MLLEAMSDKRISERNIKLVVAGEFYEDKTPYLEKIKDLNLTASVLMHTEYIEKASVKDFFCSADLVVQPYLSATQSGITQIAYYFGRPMLVTNVGGLAEMVTNGRVGYVVETNAQSIVNAICDFYDNNREKEFSSNADTDKEKFSWTSFVKGINEVYNQINVKRI
jgi:glycosyltransferase involved in cell wall biosynthesis